MSDNEDIKEKAARLMGDLFASQMKGDVRSIVNVGKVRFEPDRSKPAKDTPKSDKETGTARKARVPVDNKRELERAKAPLMVEQPTHGSASERLLAQAIKAEYIYGMLGLILGIASIVGGIVLGLHGVAGSTSWTASVLGLESKVNDAAPGVVLFIVGLFFVWITKPKVTMKDIQG